MFNIEILGQSPMVDDIRYYGKHGFAIGSINTEDFTGETSDKVYVSCIGSPRSYLTKVETLEKLGITRWCDLIMKNGSVHLYTAGNGNIIFPSYISRTAKFGRHCLVMPNTTIHHGSYLGDGSNIASNVVLNGEVKLEGNCFIGAGTVVKERVSICKNVLIGANSYIHKDIVVPGIYYGNPAT